MAVSQMQRVQIFAHSSHRAPLIKDLQDLELVHINNLNEQKESPEETPTESEIKVRIRNIQSDLSRLQSTINYLSNFEEKKGLIASFLGSSKPVLSPEEYANIAEEAARYEWRSICDECQDFEDQSARLTGRESRLHAEREHLTSWSNLDVSIEDLRDTEKTVIRIGVVPLNAYDLLSAEAKSSSLDVVFEVIGTTRTDSNILVIFMKSDEQEVTSLLARYGFSAISLPVTSGTVKDRLNQIDEELAEISAQRKKIAERSAQLASHKDKLMAIYDHLNEFLQQEKIKESFAHTDYTFMIDGWIRKKDVKELENKLSKKYEEIEIVTSEPTEDDEPPVELENGPLSTPYGMVTRLYGIPRYKEIDPTRLFAPFLSIGFAICLTDAGYGFLVALVSLIVLIVSRKKSDLFKILLICGLATGVIGTVTGGWFGVSGDRLPSFLRRLVLLDPNVRQLAFLSLIVLFGYIEVWFGSVVKMYIYLKERNWIGAFCEQFPWVLTMILIPAYIFAKRAGVPSTISSIFLAIVLLCLLLIVIFTGRGIKNPAGRIGTGLFELYSRITGTFGDTLSYMRLFALGLATGIIASSVNTIAGMLWTGPVGKVGTIIVLIFGHPFNIVINSLGGFIHSMRLQFVEFFTKFYEGGGTEFRPFKKEHVYISVIGDD